MELVLSTVRHRNIKSEVVAVSEYVPYKIHMLNIFLGQGYALHKHILYEDNAKETSYPGHSYLHLSLKPLKPKCNPGNMSLKYKGLTGGCKRHFLVRI